MKKQLLLSLFFISSIIHSQNSACEPFLQCVYQLTLYSSDGSGWNGNTMSVIQNNQIIANVGETFTNGASMIVNVAVCDDTNFELIWNQGGQFPEKVKVVLATSNLLNIYIKEYGVGIPNSSLFSAVSHCGTDCCFFYPTNLSVSSITENSVVGSWENFLGANRWDVYLTTDLNENNIPNDASFITTSDFPALITNLEDCTTYKMHARYRCSDTSVGSWSEQNVIFTTNCILSDDNFQWDKIKIYPNPSSNSIHFSSIENVNKIQIFDVFGKLLYRIEKEFMQPTISIATFEKGVYFIQLHSIRSSKTFPLIKN